MCCAGRGPGVPEEGAFSDLFVADKYGRVPMGFACINGDSTSVKWIEGVVKGEKETTLKFRDSDTDRLLGISDEKINKHTWASKTWIFTKFG